MSAVHSANGYRADLAAISRIAANFGAWFFVDACQAAGAVPLDVVRDGVDFLAAASHKFLLGSRAMGYLYVRRDLSPTASKLDVSLAWFPALADQAALGIFRRFGTSALLERNARLARFTCRTR